VETYYDYLRTYAPSLGSRIVEMYPPLEGPADPIAAPIGTLLRKPLPAQALTISGLAKALKTARWVARISAIQWKAGEKSISVISYIES
jgi:hypothetical protein